MKQAEVVHQNLHLQGFTSDGTYLYWSFTDSLVKTTLSGTMVAQVPVLGGHLGDIDRIDGKIYGSLMGNSLAGRPWGVWTSFQVNVYDAGSLSLLDAIRLDDCYGFYAAHSGADDAGGFNGIDGITRGVDPETGAPALMVACALFTGEGYREQQIFQYSFDGHLQKIHRIPTGNTVFGIQNLDFEADTGRYWFSTYSREQPYQPEETLYCVESDLKTVRASYRYSTPYGFECLGGGKFFASLQSGRNGDRAGVAYTATEETFRTMAGREEEAAR